MNLKTKMVIPYILLLMAKPVLSENKNDCIHEAAQCFKINPVIIKAIIMQESSNRQNIININKNKTIDVGVMQINSIHFNDINLYGISAQDLKENSCLNVFSGAWILNKIIKKNGYTWEGIGSYHSNTPALRDKYVSSLIKIIINDNQTINSIHVPYHAGSREKFPCD